MEEKISLRMQTTGMDKKVLLSTLWLFAMLNYAYGDVVTLMDSGMLKQYLTGNVDGLHLTQGFLLGASIFQEIPILMILLSRILTYRQNRLANIVAGLIMTVALIPTLLVGTPTMHYVFFSLIEISCTTFIIWKAWRWKE
jgi:hypothetical protein